MEFNPGLEVGTVLTNQELMDVFKCANSSGMRRSKRTNSLVIINDYTKGLYDNQWDGDVLHYTGMGQTGDQSLTYLQNANLNESGTNGINLFLFEVVKRNEYTYLGPIVLHDTPYQARQPGQDGVMRNVWIFPLKLKENVKASSINHNLMEQKANYKEKEASRLSDDELKGRAKKTGSKNVAKRNVTVKEYDRNIYIVEYTKRRAAGTCELCKNPAPFVNKNKEPYLEVHHIDWLASGGEDTIQNTVALCPNCHKKMHVVDQKEDVEKLKQIVKEF